MCSHYFGASTVFVTVPSTSSVTVPSTGSGTEDPGVEPAETTVSNCSLYSFLIIVRIIYPFHKQFTVVNLVGQGTGQ